MRTLPIIAIVIASATAHAKPFRETAKSHIDKATKAHKAGKFKRFGISNFSPEQVEELVEIAERKGE